MAGLAGPSPPAAGMIRASVAGPAAAALTPKEALGILRRHIWLIIIVTALGFGTGGLTWYILKGGEYHKGFPRYTAKTYIQVLPPVETDPMTIGGIQLQKDILYGHRMSIVGLIKQQGTLQELLARDKVRQTDWFRRRGSIRKAFKNLNRHFGAYTPRDGEFVEISMTCRSDEE